MVCACVVVGVWTGVTVCVRVAAQPQCGQPHPATVWHGARLLCGRRSGLRPRVLLDAAVPKVALPETGLLLLWPS